MLKSYIKIALRNLIKNPLYSLINIGGLSVGLAGFIIILLYLNHELSYDKWDPSLENVYKISARTDEDILEQTPAPLARFLKDNLSEISASTTIQTAGEFEIPLSSGNKRIYQKGSIEVDSNFLKVFPYKMILGDAATALNKPNAMVISLELSQKLFGDQNPIGKTVKLFNIIENEITAVMEKPAGPSHLNTQFFWRSPYEKGNLHWENWSYLTYVKTKQVNTVKKLESAVNAIYYDQRLKTGNQSLDAFRKGGHQAGLFVDAVKNLHNFPKHGNSNFTTVSVLLILSTLLLIAGAINFSNLSLAASIRRTKEVGIRKVLGSNRRQVLWQFIGEIAIQCTISLSLSILMVNLALPYFNAEFNVNLSYFQSGNAGFIAAQIALCLLIVVILSGLYPAVVLSHTNTSNVLKGHYSTGSKGIRFRNGLIMVQFVVASFFIFGTIVINRQMHFMQTKDKGYSDQQVMRIEAIQKTRDTDFDAVQTVLLNLPGIQFVSKTTTVPGDRVADTSTVAIKYDGKQYRMSSVKVSSDYFKTLRINLLKGRQFDGRYADQNTRTVILNQTAARKLNLADPVGKTITFPYCDSVPLQVVGVVKDFNVASFENTVLPVVYTINNKACNFQSGGAILLKLNSNNIPQSIAAIEQTWKKIEPDLPLRYSFLDENFQKLFAANIRLQRIISFFTITAILISVMGLFALTAFLTRQRNKEIGIRKVLGASVAQITTLLSKSYLSTILIAFLIASPIAWYAMNRWLQNFAYRITIEWWFFILTGLLVIVIAFVTVSFQAIKAALANPVKSLRTE